MQSVLADACERVAGKMMYMGITGNHHVKVFPQLYVSPFRFVTFPGLHDVGSNGSLRLL